jgi:hypothetical protein
LEAGYQPTSVQEKESRFATLLQIAGTARSQFDEALMRAVGDDMLARTDLPEHLLISMSYLASYQNKALLWCLANPEASYGAEILARGLLEFLAQTAFVLGKETDHPVGTAQQRATCVSLARAREEYAVLSDAVAGGVIDRDLTPARDRVNAFQEMHDRLGCPARVDPWPCTVEGGRPCRHKSQWPCFHVTEPRPRSTVRYTLELLAQRLRRRWLLDLYVTSSLISHQQMIDRILWWRPGEEVDLPGPPPYQYRATILSASIGAYGQALGWILETHSPEEAKRLEPYFGALYQISDWQAVASGAWDS